MSLNFDKAFEKVVGLEGGYVNHPNDRGGPTRFGITEKTARNNGYQGDMKDLPLEKAKEIYFSNYWRPLDLDVLKDPTIAEEIFEAAVNCGPSRVGEWVREVVFSMTDLDPKTCLFKTFLEKINDEEEFPFLKALNVMQGRHYLKLCRENPSQKVFVKGWFKRVSLK